MIIDQNAVKPHIINETSSRKILGMGGTLMMVEVTLPKVGSVKFTLMTHMSKSVIL